ncbi:transglycosylase SLT domain-containing protein [Thiomonas sp.]|uniref:transglycosylase SLT domain-containing protein n=1 Tax=Thiomonas sp. TaxID=2047785 RepID=UPI002623F450|nr:transglycosylase SLT domain-containing protein [Thiomonas sp.]
MQRLRGVRFWALAAVVLMAAGCAAPPRSPVSASLVAPQAGASAPMLAAAASSAAPLAGASAAAAIAPTPAASAAVAAAEPQYTDIWQRIRAGFGIPDMDGPHMQPYVQQAVQWYTTRPDYVARMTERSRKYLYYIVQEVQRRNMPTELALLPFIESAFNPDALSSAKASGMWQFIPSTGKHYNLRQTMFQDGRRDVMASTRAALDYLTKLHAMFGNWQLALAAYNWGEGGVQRAIAYNQAHGLPVDYSHLRMPQETRNYYPKLQAVKDIIEHPDQYGITLPSVPDHPYFKPVTITQDIDVSKAARLAGISVADFRSLNPAFKKPVILAATHPQILLPYDNATEFEQALAAHQGPLARWTAYRVERTSSPAALAEHLHLAVATLREVNDIPSRTLIKAGSTVLVPRPPQDDANVSKHVAENAVLTLAPVVPPLRRLRLYAGRFDTPTTVARRYGISVAEVARWNHVRENARFRPHSMVIVYTHELHPHRELRLAEARRDHARELRLAEQRRQRAVRVAQHRRGAGNTVRVATRSPHRLIRVAER